MGLWLLLVWSALAVLTATAVLARRRRPVRLPAATGDRPCAVYIIPSRQRRPAYVGKGFDPWARIACHRREAWWWPHVDTARNPQVLWLPSEQAALARESSLIGELAPLFNDRHNRGRGVRRPVVSHPASTVAGWDARSRSASSSPGSFRV